MPSNESGPQEFKPNIYPIMYWGLVFGISAGMLLFAVFLLSRFVVYIWFPVFLAGLLWGGYRNYQQQKRAWQQNTGDVGVGPPLEEIKAAARDIVLATREILREDTAPDAAGRAAAAHDEHPTEPPSPPAPAR